MPDEKTSLYDALLEFTSGISAEWASAALAAVSLWIAINADRRSRRIEREQSLRRQPNVDMDIIEAKRFTSDDKTYLAVNIRLINHSESGNYASKVLLEVTYREIDDQPALLVLAPIRSTRDHFPPPVKNLSIDEINISPLQSTSGAVCFSLPKQIFEALRIEKLQLSIIDMAGVKIQKPLPVS